MFPRNKLNLATSIFYIVSHHGWLFKQVSPALVYITDRSCRVAIMDNGAKRSELLPPGKSPRHRPHPRDLCNCIFSKRRPLRTILLKTVHRQSLGPPNAVNYAQRDGLG